MVGYPGPIIIGKGSWIRIHLKKGGKKSKMWKFIKVKGQFSPWELALLVGLYIVIVYS